MLRREPWHKRNINSALVFRSRTDPSLLSAYAKGDSALSMSYAVKGMFCR
jgi:hypothetical protein